MIRDAHAVTGLTPRGWMLDPLIAKIAAQMRIVIPPLDRVADEAPPLPAFVNWGDWKVMCDEPMCFGKAEDIWRDWLYMLCMSCGNRQHGGHWRPVVLPEDWAEIEARLESLPRSARNWHPTEPGLGGPPSYVAGDVEDDPLTFMTIEQQNRAKALPDPTQGRED